MKKKNIVIFGAGGLGIEVLELINQINKVLPTWNVEGFYDDTLSVGNFVNGFPILGGSESLQKSVHENVVVAIGNPEVRAHFIKLLIVNKTLPVLIHPSAIVPSEKIFIGAGTVVAANVFISVNVNVGIGNLLNVGCSVGHDVLIGDFCTINPGCRISGSVILGDYIFAGVGSILNNKISIVSNVKIGAGAVVIKSVEKKSTVFGNPARVVLE